VCIGRGIECRAGWGKGFGSRRWRSCHGRPPGFNGSSGLRPLGQFRHRRIEVDSPE
jgi:hypothetical protein